MSTQENGLAANVARPAAVAIASTTTATPIQVTTSTLHGLTTGDTVMVRGVANDLAANGIYSVTVIDTTNFTLDGTTGVGAGGAESSATVRSLGYNSTFAIPADAVDDMNAASVNVGFEALADRSALLAMRSGNYFLVDDSSTYHDDDTNGIWSANTTYSAGSDQWGEITSTPTLTLWGAKSGDYFELDFVAALNLTLSTAIPKFAFGTSSNKIAGTSVILPGLGSGQMPIVMRSFVPVTATWYQQAPIRILARKFASGAPQVYFYSDYVFRARLWRPV